VSNSKPQLACPKCGLLDQVRKVSAICTSDTTLNTSDSSTIGVGLTRGGNVAIGGASTTTRGLQRTHLSLKLAPPPEMHPFIGSSRDGALALFAFGLVAALVEAYMIVSRSAMGGLVVLPAVAAILLFAASYWLNGRSRRKDVELREEYDKRQIAWRRRVEVWSRVYDCFRDDIVFDPESGKWSDPDNLAALLDTNG
jgi:hypothetical protein